MKSKCYFLLNPFVFSCMLLLLGIVFYWQLGNKTGTLYEIGKILSGVLLSSGSIGLLLEISTIRNIIVEVFKSVLDVEFDFDCYSKDKLSKFQKKILIAKSDNKFDNNHFVNSIYCLEDDLFRLAMSRYYDYEEQKCWICPDDENGIFKKRVNRKLCIVNKSQSENSISLNMKVFVDEKTNPSIINFTKFLVNNKDFLNEVEEYIEIEKLPENDYSPYSHFFHFKRPLASIKTHEIEFEYDYVIPISDFTQSYKISIPCKSLSHKIFLIGKNANKWALSINGFASMFYSGSLKERNFKVIEHTLSSCEVNFDHWVLPGAGYVASFRKL